MTYKRSFQISFFTIIILLAFIAGFNYSIDPGRIFSESEYERGIANIIITKKNVANIVNYDERLVQKYIINKFNEAKDIVVIGSSRTMQIRQDLFIDKTFFNSSVSGASLEDYIAIISLYNKKGLLPKKIIIGLDPWILNKNSGQNRWKSIESEYYDIIDDISYSNENKKQNKQFDNIYKYHNLISMPYLKKSLSQYKDLIINKKNNGYFATDKYESEVAIKLNDGSISYPYKVKNVNKKDVDKLAFEYTNTKSIYSLANFNELDNEIKDRFEKFILYLKSKNIEIVFILPPYHPIVYNKINSDNEYKMVNEAENYFNKVATENGIISIGSYNPYKCNFTGNDFLDGMHLKLEGTNKLVRL